MNESEVSKYNYSKKSIFQIAQNNKNDYIEAANKINKLSQVKLVHIEHEFGIYGENFGSNILYFMKEIKNL